MNYKVTPPIKCWLHTGHGYLGIQGAIKNSCNTFFNQVVYDLGTDSDGNFSDSLGLEKLRKYAELFQLDQKSGLEITEAEPQITDEAAVASAIGQGTNNYTTSQLARYATTIASRGNIYSLSLLDKVTDSKGNLIEDYTPELKATMDIPNNEWDIIHAGMREVVENNDAFQDLITRYPVRPVPPRRLRPGPATDFSSDLLHRTIRRSPWQSALPMVTVPPMRQQ